MVANQESVADFNYRGEIPGSKSLLNRLLICASHCPRPFEIVGHSSCEDVEKMSQSLQALRLASEAKTTEGLGLAEAGASVSVPRAQGRLDCGSGGTTLRFLALRASRLPGRWTLTGTERLFSRPQGALVEMAQSLGVSLQLQRSAPEAGVGALEVSLDPARGGFPTLVVDSQGWQKPQGPVLIDASRSSQFLSAVVLNAWDLPFELKLHVVGGLASRGYWEMTKKLVIDLGMELREESSVQALCEIVIPPGQQIKKTSYVVEPDMSSAFTVAALAALGGQVELLNFPQQSLQPDAVFVELLQQMGVKVELENSARTHPGALSLLRVQGNSSKALRPLTVNLESCPDLFPVLAVLCALAPGRSRLFGAPQLVHKESNRIVKVAELLNLMGRECELTADGLVIVGKAPDGPRLGDRFSSSVTLFDPDQDHRLAFAATLAAQAGFAIQVSDPSVVNKSFPEFWQVVAEGRGRQ